MVLQKLPSLVQDRCLHHLFEAQVERTPEARAVIFPSSGSSSRQSAPEQLTYRELNERANQLAHYLQQTGVGPDTPVGLCLERSLDMVVGVLAILKAGGAYLPLDPAYPQERLAFMITDSRLPVLVTRTALAAKAPALQARVVCLDDLRYPPLKVNPTSPAGRDNLAYIIYTSGSTGRPKGVAMPHGPLVNLVEWQGQNSTAGAGTRTLQFSPLSFDVSCQEMFSTWDSGGTLVLIQDELRRDGLALWRFLVDNQVDRLFLPFIALQNLAQAAESQAGQPARLAEIMTAGEQLQITPAIARLFQVLPAGRLYNQYGPTESHVVAAFPLTGPPERWPALPPIGRPIAKTRLQLLDEHLQPAPAGEVGELYIGGAGLARGYLHRPDLTAEKFIPDPAAVEPGARLYRTGDLARRLPDGNIEFLGRRDDQVKIRGVRVEPGEIEAALRQYDRVREAVVAAQAEANDPGAARLVAYIVPDPAAPPPTGLELRHFLQQKLPEPMIPALFVLVEALPLTPSGKIDRRSLPDPGQARPAAADIYVAPRTPLEQELGKLWAELLGLDRIGLEDDFFELGGHSLLATQLTSRLRQMFQVELSVQDLFETPTVAALAQRLELMRWAAQGQQAGPGEYEEGEL